MLPSIWNKVLFKNHRVSDIIFGKIIKAEHILFNIYVYKTTFAISNGCVSFVHESCPYSSNNMTQNIPYNNNGLGKNGFIDGSHLFNVSINFCWWVTFGFLYIAAFAIKYIRIIYNKKKTIFILSINHVIRLSIIYWTLKKRMYIV